MCVCGGGGGVYPKSSRYVNQTRTNTSMHGGNSRLRAGREARLLRTSVRYLPLWPS